jgi:hypothetical protein
MKIRIVSSKDETRTLNPNERMIHMAFRASNVDFLNLMKRCPRVRAIQIPKSYIKTMSDAIQGFLEMQGHRDPGRRRLGPQKGSRRVFRGG